MKDNVSSERHQNNNLKSIIAFAEFFGPHTTFYPVPTSDQLTKFLGTKMKANTHTSRISNKLENFLT
jgi:hypothetical protein